ncbi:hypothetical protein [Roseospira visakhapatnamensis]|uniref:Lipoprotein n=1 Tax=Roseospira visakhapatnamensis TaxID=390880 RepID=A0A7W6RFN3_9PROT|nr:hypothetical protein [Roseospira visakhapatnamensis]MBB4267638.1 hypothetical protein [Roseospira visakhapatnamensis]
MTLTHARTVSAIVLLALALGGCATGGAREMPQEGSGSDAMKKSPCACLPLDFNAGGYLWRG